VALGSGQQERTAAMLYLIIGIAVLAGVYALAAFRDRNGR
jgi:hypothetical protein